MSRDGVLAGPTDRGTSPAPSVAQRTAVLIGQLGDPQYAVRQQAQEELAKLGPEAFDSLVLAEENDDLEIAARARYLVHLIRIDWIHATDSPLVKEALNDYDAKSLRDRRVVVLRLAQMPRSESLEPLCRLIRFEKSALVAKEGAIYIMLQPEAAESAWPQQAKQITRALAGSDRPPARWLRNYVRSHDDPEAALAEWDKLVTEELAVVDATDPQSETSLQNLLMRNYAQMLLARQHRDRAIAVMRKMIGRVSDNVTTRWSASSIGLSNRRLGKSSMRRRVSSTERSQRTARCFTRKHSRSKPAATKCRPRNTPSRRSRLFRRNPTMKSPDTKWPSGST